MITSNITLYIDQSQNKTNFKLKYPPPISILLSLEAQHLRRPGLSQGVGGQQSSARPPSGSIRSQSTADKDQGGADIGILLQNNEITCRIQSSSFLFFKNLFNFFLNYLSEQFKHC